MTETRRYLVNKHSCWTELLKICYERISWSKLLIPALHVGRIAFKRFFFLI